MVNMMFYLLTMVIGHIYIYHCISWTIYIIYTIYDIMCIYIYIYQNNSKYIMYIHSIYIGFEDSLPPPWWVFSWDLSANTSWAAPQSPLHQARQGWSWWGWFAWAKLNARIHTFDTYTCIYIYIHNYNYKYNPSISKYCFHPGINIIAIATLFQIRCLPFKLSTRSHKTNCHHRWESHHLMAMLGPDKSKVLQGSVAQGERFSGSA